MQVRAIVAIDPRAYREVIGSAIQRLRPYLEVTVVEPDLLESEAARTGPKLVLSSQRKPAAYDDASAWIEYRPYTESRVTIHIGDHRLKLDAVDLSDLLSIVDRAEDMVRASLARPSAAAIEILLAEDDPDDALLAMQSLANSEMRIRLHHVKDGVEAVDFVRRRSEDANTSLPNLILLDLNLPRKDGREVLAQIKTDPQLRHIPVVILSDSEDERDLVESYDLHANAYVVKPRDRERFKQAMQAIENFWFTIAQLRDNEVV